MSEQRFISVDEVDGKLDVSLSGAWTVRQVADIDPVLKRIEADDASAAHFSCEAIEQLDLSGAWLLLRFARRLEAQGIETNIEGLSRDQLQFIRQLSELEKSPPQEPEEGIGTEVGERLEGLGRDVVRQFLELADFSGRTFVAFVSALSRPDRFRMAPLFYHIEQAGIRAVPIVALIGFLIAIVLAYQGANQLQAFGAEIYTVDLVAISILREMGVVLTAIMVAGRSGSAFAAEIGVMKLNEEIDAMRVLGIDPLKTLVIPRLLALVISLPLLTFIADLVSLGGAALLSNLFLDIPFPLFVSRLKDAVDLSTFLVGIVKAPVFGFIIAMVGCRRGMQVKGSADELGRMTTTAVVECIFLVILADAAFSVLFSELGI